MRMLTRLWTTEDEQTEAQQERGACARRGGLLSPEPALQEGRCSNRRTGRGLGWSRGPGIR